MMMMMNISGRKALLQANLVYEAAAVHGKDNTAANCAAGFRQREMLFSYSLNLSSC